MSKDTFAIFLDTKTNLRYVKKVQDELQKNHKECDGEIITGFMPEIKGDRLCPVRSFEMYFSLLNPRCEALWQRPLAKQNAEGDCYARQRVGHNPLATFLSKLSVECKLSQKYTNHDIRVTACTILFHCKFSNKEIMALTGHKSVNSLAIYQKVNHDQKLAMGGTLNMALTNPRQLEERFPSIQNPSAQEITETNELMALLSTDDSTEPNNQLALPAPKDQENCQQNAIVPVPSPAPPVAAPQNMPTIPNFDLMDFLADLDDDNFNTITNANAVVPSTSQVAVNQTNTVYQNNPKPKPQMPIFNGCKIGNININIINK